MARRLAFGSSTGFDFDFDLELELDLDLDLDLDFTCSVFDTIGSVFDSDFDSICSDSIGSGFSVLSMFLIPFNQR